MDIKENHVKEGDAVEFKLPFIGRVGELARIRDYSTRQLDAPILVYGPEGCGKSRLFLEAVRRFGEWFEDGLAVYVNAEEARDPRKIFSIAVGKSVGVAGDSKDLVAGAVRAAMEFLNIEGGSLAGSAVALAITPILERLYIKLKLRGMTSSPP